MIYKQEIDTWSELRVAIQAERETEERFWKVLENLNSDISPATMRQIFDQYNEAKNGN
jgi:hypothetical protein